MSTWHSKETGDGIEALGPSQQLYEAFIELAKLGGLLPGVGVFSRYDLRANKVTWYFSPEAMLLATSFGATPCEKPAPTKGFGLVVGYSQSWEVHFPGYLNGRH